VFGVFSEVTPASALLRGLWTHAQANATAAAHNACRCDIKQITSLLRCTRLRRCRLCAHRVGARLLPPSHTPRALTCAHFHRLYRTCRTAHLPHSPGSRTLAAASRARFLLLPSFLPPLALTCTTLHPHHGRGRQEGEGRREKREKKREEERERKEEEEEEEKDRSFAEQTHFATLRIRAALHCAALLPRTAHAPHAAHGLPRFNSSYFLSPRTASHLSAR